MPFEKPALIHLDVDAGVDDSLALMLAIHEDELSIVGISTVSGNISARQAHLNTEFLLRQFKMPRRIPVATGSMTALDGRRPAPVPHIHGPDGLGGIRAPKGDPSENEGTLDDAASPGIEALIDVVRTHGRKLTLVCMGPMTNLARAIQRAPDVMQNAREVLAMGGAFEVPGNMPGGAEFNVFCDPDALQVVAGSGVPLTLFPLDVTERVRLLAGSLRSDLNLPVNELQLIRDLTAIYMKFHLETHQFDGCYLHDALPVAALLKPELFSIRQRTFVIERDDLSHRGRVRWTKENEPGLPVRVALDVEADAVLDLFWAALRRPVPICTYTPRQPAAEAAR